MGAIDTDMAIGTILSNFSSDYITHVMEDSLQLEKKFRPFGEPMPNFVDVLNRNFLAVYAEAPDYSDKVQEVRIETFKEIILMICRYYNLSFCAPFEEIPPEELYGIARKMYDIFVSNYTDNMINFFTGYIIRNADQIIKYLQSDPTAIKPKEVGLYDHKNYIDPKFILIHANINKVIYNMASYDIDLTTLLSYFYDQIAFIRMNSLLRDNGDIYKNHYAICLRDQRYVAGILTNVKLRLQSMTYETIQIETK
jgi:hypothetical protein